MGFLDSFSFLDEFRRMNARQALYFCDICCRLCEWICGLSSHERWHDFRISPSIQP